MSARHKPGDAASLEIALEPRHLELAERVAQVARERLEPIEAEGGTEDAQARRFLGVMADEDLLVHALPGGFEQGGVRFDSRALCVVREHLARASGFADVMFAMQGLGSAPLALAGDVALKARLLPRVRRGESIGAFALTEPEAGTDVASIRTLAVKHGGDYVLNGTKTLISNAGVADVICVFATTDPGAGHHGITAFLVEGGAPGLTVAERQKVMAPHPIGTLRFEDCVVPAVQRLGAEGEGFALAMRVLDLFRPTVGAAALGFARRALAEALARIRSRRVFQQPLGRFQLIQSHVAHMAADLEAARLLVYRAATRADLDGAPDTLKASLAKWYATEAAQRVVDRAVQVFGGAGVLSGAVVERLYREVRALRIYEGTSEIQQVVVATRLLKDDAPGY